MKIFNTLSRKKETFKPIKPKEVKMYVCGPTVYDVGHLGHARAAVCFDLIRRYLIYKGFKVTFVSNITDVDDKLIKRASEEAITEKELAERIIPEYEKDYGALNILPPDKAPRATKYIPEMTALVEKLLKKGIAYATEDGIYFEVSKFPAYGKLSNQKLEQLRAGARIEVDEKKKNPEDFALWKRAKPGEPVWKGPNGMPGRPGWHIECSAMSTVILGETIDIHGGGIDLMFPHHEDEIAQSESATGKEFAAYWLHNGHIKVNNEKMSKSLGNFFTIKSVLEKYHSMAVRYFLLSTHYRMPIDFSDDLLEQTKNSLERIYDCYRALKRIVDNGKKNVGDTFDTKTILKRARDGFVNALDDDFEIATALGALFDFINEVNISIKDNAIFYKEARILMDFFKEIDAVLGILEQGEIALSPEIEKLIEARNSARRSKNFKQADEIRTELEKRGIILEDTKDGTVWKKAL